MTKEEAQKQSAEELTKNLGTSVETGLKTEEAERRLGVDGLNSLPKEGHSGLKTFFNQFKSSMVYLLIGSSLVSFALTDILSGIVIMTIVVINVGLGFYQEYKSEKLVEGLSKFVSKQAVVRRDGLNQLIDSSLIVTGDVVILKEGDIVPADIKITEVDGLETNESQLTGETVAVSKKENDLIYSGSIIENGGGEGIVYATGENTEFGSIARVSAAIKRETRYEKSLNELSFFLVRIVGAILAIVFMVKMWLDWGSFNLIEVSLFIIAMAVATVPESLPVIASISLSNGALKLAKKHVVVKHLTSVEDLGNVTMLCTDKTGTLTENKMTITGIVSEDQELFMSLAYASVEKIGIGRKKYQNAYDEAFSAYATKKTKESVDERMRTIKEFPFDSDARRRRAVIYDKVAKKYFLVVIGSPETLLQIAETGRSEQYKEILTEEGNKGLRHLALAYKEVAYDDNFDIIKSEPGIDFLGFVTFTDLLRATSQQTIKEAEALGISIKILSGDSKEVSEYVGKEVGLISGNQKVYTGDELFEMSADEFRRVINENNVFARVNPEQKYRIIATLKENNIVAYQGDGINDAPSLKLADVSIAVSSATDVAKESSDIVLLKRNLEVVIDGIKYGRSIFVNINKFIRHTMISNFGNLIALSILFLLSSDLPMQTIQVLLLTVIADIPMIAISTDSVDKDEIVRPEKQDIRGLMSVSLVLGIPTAAMDLGYFFLIRNETPKILQTSLFIFLALTGLVVFYAIRTKRHFWRSRPSTPINIAFVAAFLISVLITYLPIFQRWFGFVSLQASTIMIITIFTIGYLFLADLIYSKTK